MAILPSSVLDDIDYPTSDGRPMAETDVHRENMVDLIAILKARYAHDPMVYVSGNLLLYYVRGDRRRHVSPDVFVVWGVPSRRRDHFLLWEEGKSPELVIELTSQSTRREDLDDKFRLYRETLGVREYFLFDPHAEYLEPPLQGHRLHEGQYMPIEAREGRLPSELLGLHLEGHGWELRLYDPTTDRWLPTPQEEAAQARAALHQSEAARQSAEAEIERLRRKVAELRDSEELS